MKKLLATLVFAAAFASPAHASDVFDASPTLRFCAAGMISGFGNGLDERACAKYFDLPSNYHFACARGLLRGFKTSIDRAACVSFFEGQVAAAKTAYVRPQ
jgi:opacity protein-like surface antigen